MERGLGSHRVQIRGEVALAWALLSAKCCFDYRLEFHAGVICKLTPFLTFNILLIKCTDDNEELMRGGTSCRYILCI